MKNNIYIYISKKRKKRTVTANGDDVAIEYNPLKFNNLKS